MNRNRADAVSVGLLAALVITLIALLAGVGYVACGRGAEVEREVVGE